MKHRRQSPPWKRPSRLVWFVLALCAACWLTLHMPHVASVQRSSTTSATESTTSGIQERPHVPSESPAVTSTTSRRTARSATEKISTRLRSFSRLFAIVGIAAFLGGILEARRWHLALVRFMGRLTQVARLPEIVGLAMPTALCSNAAANSMLVSSHAEGRIRYSALIAGGMANSYLAYVSHSIRVMYPVIGAAGIPAALYFATQFTGGLLVILGVFCWNRWHVTRHANTLDAAEQSATVPDNPSVTSVVQSNTAKKSLDQPLPWPEALRTSWVRAATLLFRMVCLTVPLMLGIEWLLKSGAFRFWEQAVPEQVTRFFPAELMSVVAAQMGGLVQSASVAANLRTEGLIDNAQILLAMLVGSAVGNPFRTLRRNLPSALGIFPSPVALTIVLGMQFSRLMTTLVSIVLVIAFMHYVLY